MTKFYKILDAVTAWIRFVERITDWNERYQMNIVIIRRCTWRIIIL